MIGLRFEEQPPTVVSAPNRADIACFVGFVCARGDPLRAPAPVRDWLATQGKKAAVPFPRAVVDWLRAQGVPEWLREQGWMSPPYGRSGRAVSTLLDVPLPIDTWDEFDRLFAWERRPVDGSGTVTSTYMGAAIRSFFAQGGRKCYVVRVGDPVPFVTERAARLKQLARIIPGHPRSFNASPLDPSTWHGVAHLFGLPDVSFLCVPDLADIVGVDPDPIPAPGFPPPPERFAECLDGEVSAAADIGVQRVRARRCDEEGYRTWAAALHVIAGMLARWLSEVQLMAAVPIPLEGTPAEHDLLEFLGTGAFAPLAGRLAAADRFALASAFVQLVYPWVRTPGSLDLPEQLESPDAVLTGLLARNALTEGTFRSAARLHVSDVYEVVPSLSREQMYTARPDEARAGAAQHALVERVSLLGPTPAGLALLSDVTTYLGESYRSASVSRLVSVILRAARRLGEDVVFEASNEALWARLREGLNTLLTGLFRVGALGGATAAEAFQVRCDRSTMSQNDLDNGRVVTQIQFVAAAPIETITVVLAVDEGGQVSLVHTANA